MNTENEEWIMVRDATKLTGYNDEYITQLIRRGEVVGGCSTARGLWYTAWIACQLSVTFFSLLSPSFAPTHIARMKIPIFTPRNIPISIPIQNIIHSPHIHSCVNSISL
jgi:hypothetical protein